MPPKYVAFDNNGVAHVGDKETVERESGNKAAPIHKSTYERMDDFLEIDGVTDIVDHSRPPTDDEISCGLDWR